MSCTNPRTVGFTSTGDLAWSPKFASREYPPIKLPCGKCIDCRMAHAREKSIRCVHEAQMHEQNCFITLTYNDENLPPGSRLIYRDWQLFMKRLRKSLHNQSVGFMVTGEYGEKNKRPHWHAILFGWRPDDLVLCKKNETGDPLYSSATLEALWAKNDSDTVPNYVGDVTLKSAGYVARYSLKKLVHGYDQNHNYHPIHKMSSKHAIGKKWLEKHWPDIFNYGECRVDGVSMPVPRYYEKWLQKNRPADWIRYVTETKSLKIEKAEKRQEEDEKIYALKCEKRRPFRGPAVTKKQARAAILKQKIDQLNKFTKD